MADDRQLPGAHRDDGRRRLREASEGRLATDHRHAAFFAALIAVSIVPPGARAGLRGPGESSGEFLRIYSDARPAALAGAYTALSDNAAALHYNPAGLVRPVAREVTASYALWFAEGTFQHISYTHPMGGGLDAWGLSILHYDPGSFERTNELGLGTGTRLRANDIAVTAGYARKLGRFWALGAGAKYVHRTLHVYSAATAALDLGLLYWTPVEGLVASLAVQNLGGTLTFLSDRERLPLTFRGGLAYTPTLAAVTVTMDLVQTMDEHGTVALGVEGRATENVKLRFGWSPERDLYRGLTAGAGITVQAITIDYAYVPFDIFGGTHRVTGTVRFGGPTVPEVHRVPDSPWPSPKATAPRPDPYRVPEARPSPPRPRVSGTAEGPPVLRVPKLP